MIDPEDPSKTACHLMLATEGRCIGRECSAFRWTVYDAETFSVRNDLMGSEEAVRANVERDKDIAPGLRVAGYCGLVGLP